MTDLLQTKLRVPPARRQVVDRARLIDLLTRGMDAKLVLLSAPPGFGKTTLVAQWITRAWQGQAAWLSLDEGDNDRTTLWRYLLSAVAAVAPAAGATARSILDADDAQVDLALRAFLNDLAESPPELVVVLDDFHAIEAVEIHRDLEFLLDHLPPHVHLVILTRSDPPLPLARMRVRGELVEIRAADLRFTDDEAAAYLNDLSGLALTVDDVSALEHRTEGWIAAIQLAALSMQGRTDVASFIATFTGEDRYVVDYLVDEVLERQPETVRDFLLETCVLDRLSGALCDAVTGRGGGSAMLEALDRANLFLIPLDDQRRWYRYHHLFADLLRTRLADQRPTAAAELHRRASAWWEASGDSDQAVGHALAAGDVDRVADLMELAADELRRTRQESKLRRWLDALPDRVFEFRPLLAVLHAGALLATGELRGVEARLAAAERWVPASHDATARAEATAAGMVVGRIESLGHLPSAIALYRAVLARMRGDIAETIAQARAALASAGEDQHLERGAAAGLLALAHWTSGELEAAHASWSDAVVNLEKAEHFADMLGCFLAMADIRMAQGRLADARATYERGLRLAAESKRPALRGEADMHVGLAELYLEWNDLAEAERHLRAAAELGESMGLPQNAYRSRVATALAHQAVGEFPGALAAIGEAEQRYVGDFFPEVRPISAQRACLWLADGRIDETLRWARERGLSTGDELSYLHEFEHVTLARALVARAQADGNRSDTAAAVQFIDRLLEAARSSGRGRSVIELVVLRALAQRAVGDRAAAPVSLNRALTLAEPEGFVRIFIQEGPPMEALLQATASAASSPPYVRRLLAAFGHRRTERTRRQPLVEPLSERELEVLRLLASDLDGPAIARELVVSLNTLRTHTKNIYAKLGVNSRREAIRRATELELWGQQWSRRDGGPPT